MKRIQGRVRDYAWGSPSVIPAHFGYPPANCPVAEVWMGAHPDDPAHVDCAPLDPLFDLSQLYPGTHGERPDITTLADYIKEDPQGTLGEAVLDRHGPELPYLLKIIAPNEPLSLQVHPSIAQACEGFAREDAAGIPRDSAERNYKDRNHKPEMTYAITQFEALAGFRSPRRILEIMRGLDARLAHDLYGIVRREGVAQAFASLLREETRPAPDDVAEVVRACASRSPESSPSRRADANVVRLSEKYPGDPGVVASLLLNPVTLRPGEAIFIPAGMVHAYLSGLAVEIMASSDNVLRAGLTPKHMDVPELLRIVQGHAAPPMRIAPERVSKNTSTFYVPVDDFELSVVQLHDANTWEKAAVHSGPRTVLCLDGAAQLDAGGERLLLNAGQAAFVPDSDGRLNVRGFGRLVVASVP
ncbi:mannose-6-phosphate isomerase, class I [Arcanobacterium haemolyticum]|nr:mannose-6-phosphate isomerase, class I [Arcanobacterium haemolyticum]